MKFLFMVNNLLSQDCQSLYSCANDFIFYRRRRRRGETVIYTEHSSNPLCPAVQQSPSHPVHKSLLLYFPLKCLGSPRNPNDQHFQYHCPVNRSMEISTDISGGHDVCSVPSSPKMYLEKYMKDIPLPREYP